MPKLRSNTWKCYVALQQGYGVLKLGDIVACKTQIRKNRGRAKIFISVLPGKESHDRSQKELRLCGVGIPRKRFQNKCLLDTRKTAFY